MCFFYVRYRISFTSFYFEILARNSRVPRKRKRRRVMLHNAAIDFTMRTLYVPRFTIITLIDIMAFEQNALSFTYACRNFTHACLRTLGIL